MVNIYCIANQKGGVGKTTTAVNLAAALSKKNKQVLLIDLDPQGNATMGSGINKNTIKTTIYDLFVNNLAIEKVLVKTKDCGYDLICANRNLSGAEIELVDKPKREFLLKNALVTKENEYDYILIDCPPSLNLLTLNALSVAHGVIVPMQCEYFALEGLTDLVATIKQVHRVFNPNLVMIGLLRIMFDSRITLQSQVSTQLKNHFGKKVFDTIIPRNVRLAEAPSYGVPGVIYDPYSKGSLAFLSFADELIKKTS